MASIDVCCFIHCAFLRIKQQIFYHLEHHQFINHFTTNTFGSISWLLFHYCFYQFEKKSHIYFYLLNTHSMISFLRMKCFFELIYLYLLMIIG